ncbi:MAG: type II toxin-antitoxin system RelB/DinJ family antitoxin [Alphaproteobacteria bacterium]|nr:type II toxin-antitoxin system RelB/DinJ family antitoxin [Alphaproteobacteria bacterium]
MKNGDRNMNTVIQARVDAESKKQAEKILKQLGITLNDAVRMLVNQIIHSRALPFQPKLPTEEEFIAQAIADSEEDIKAGRVYGPFNSVDDLIVDLEKDD